MRRNIRTRQGTYACQAIVNELLIQILSIAAGSGIVTGIFQGVLYVLRTSDRAAQHRREAIEHQTQQWKELLAESQQQLAATKEQLRSIHDQQDSQDDEKESLQRDNAKLSAEVLSLHREVHLLKDEIARLQSEVTSWKDRESLYREYEQQHYRHDFELLKQQTRIQDVIRDVEWTKTENEHLRESNHRLLIQLEEAETELAKLQNRPPPARKPSNQTDELSPLFLRTGGDAENYIRHGEQFIDVEKFFMEPEPENEEDDSDEQLSRTD